MICLHKHIASHAAGAMRFFCTEVNLTQLIIEKKKMLLIISAQRIRVMKNRDLYVENS